MVCRGSRFSAPGYRRVGQLSHDQRPANGSVSRGAAVRSLSDRDRAGSRTSCWTRPGFTLIELAVVLVILGVVGSAIGLTLLRQQRFYRGATELLYAREGVRDAIELLSTDIRGMATTDTVRLLADSAIEMFASIGSSVVCQISGADIGLPRAAPSPGNTLTAFVTQPDTGDLALFYRDSVEAGSQWERHRIAGFSSRSLAATCPVSTGFTQKPRTQPGQRGSSLRSHHSFDERRQARGAPVRFIRRARYSLYHASDGGWYLGYRRCNAIGPSACGVVQPVSGPYRGYSPDPAATGLLFEYFDRAWGRRLCPGAPPLPLPGLTSRRGARASSDLPVERRQDEFRIPRKCPSPSGIGHNNGEMRGTVQVLRLPVVPAQPQRLRTRRSVTLDRPHRCDRRGRVVRHHGGDKKGRGWSGA